MRKHLHATVESKNGFTILEVTIVTAFIALLIIAIATIFMNISALYQKGITLKTVNEVGSNLITEFTTSLNAAPSIDSVSLCNTLVTNTSKRNDCLNNGAYNFIFQEYTKNYTHPQTGESYGPVQYGGVFCTGEYSYVWNTYYGLETGDTLSVKFKELGIKEDFKLIRFADKTYRACSTNVTANYEVQDFSANPEIDVTQLANTSDFKVSDVDEKLLSASNKDHEIDLDLYELTIFPIAQDNVTLRALISGTFILATERGDINITRSGDYCDVTNLNGVGDGSSNLQDLGSNFNYCGINKFNFAARTAGNGV